MVARQVQPTNETGVRPPKGRLTWMALVGIALFVVLILAMVLPTGQRSDTPERPAPQTSPPAATAPPSPDTGG